MAGSEDVAATGSVERGEKSLERQIRAFHQVRLLAELPDRLAGSPGEKEAAERVFAWMRALGFDEVAENPVPGVLRPALRLAVPLALGATGCALGGIPGLLLAGAGALSFQREERRGVSGLSRLLGGPDSCNVTARTGATRARRRVVLCASLDAPQVGGLFSPLLAGSVGARRRTAGGALAWCERVLVAAVAVAGASALGAGGALLLAAQLLVAGALGLFAASLLQWAFAAPGPGANAASGVAAMLACAEQLHAQLRDDVELWLVAAGSGHAGAAGLRALLDAHPDWRRDRTVFVQFDRVGGGVLHYCSSEGTLGRTNYPPRLRELARRLAEGGSFAEVTPVDFVGETDGRRAVERGFACLTLVALEHNGTPRADHAAADTPEFLDMEMVVRAADFAAAVVVAHWRGDSDPLAMV